MNKVILKTEDIEYLMKWRDQHKDLVRQSPCPMKSCQLRFPDVDTIVIAHADGSTIRFDVMFGSEPIGRVEFEKTIFGLCKLKKNKTKLKTDGVQGILTVYSSLMALFVYGRGTIDYPLLEDGEKKSRTAHGKGRKKAQVQSTTYILSHIGNELLPTVKGSHRSPSCTFSVRGHYRHYKNGNVVWIQEYVKGEGKKKDKTYKVGKKGE